MFGPEAASWKMAITMADLNALAFFQLLTRLANRHKITVGGGKASRETASTVKFDPVTFYCDNEYGATDLLFQLCGLI